MRTRTCSFGRSALTLAATLALLALAGCTPPPPKPQAPPPPNVTIAHPVIKTIPVTLDLTGTTRGIETVEVRARVKGFLEKRLVEGGRRVKRGELLFLIDPRPFDAAVRQAEAELASKQATLKLNELTLQRQTEAARAKAVSQLDVDRAQADRDTALAAVALADAKLTSAKLDLEYTKVVAPIDGRIGMTLIDVGALVGASDPTLLTTIINDNQVYATYEIDERTVLELREKYQNRRPGEDGRKNLEVRLGLANEQGYPHLGRFDKADNAVNTSSGTIKIEAIFDNSDGTIIPGAFVRIQPLFGERKAMLVPETVVMADQLGRYVLIVGEKNIVQRVSVLTVGRPIDGLSPIEEVLGTTSDGKEPPRLLTENTNVIVNGLQRARPGMPVTPQTAQPAPTASAPAGKAS